MLKIDSAYTTRQNKVSFLEEDTLRKCLLEVGYFPEANIFPPILKIEQKESGVTSTEKASPILLFVPKSKQQWRDFKIVRPENYVHTVEQICSRLDKIKELMVKPDKLISYSVPFSFGEQNYRSGNQISNWHQLQEQLLSVSSKNRLPILCSFDIQSCYHTLYTHTIEWAMESVGAKRGGSKLDESIRRGNDNRTHGLPVGQYTSDVIAEIVLSWVDEKIEKKLSKVDCAGFRFKDNYYFLCKTASDADTVLSQVAQVLRGAHFTLNDSKTEIMSFVDYYASRWQADFDLLLASIQYDGDEYEFTNRNLKVFIEQTVNLSNKYGNKKSILDKAINIVTNAKFKGYINYKWLFFSVANMLPLRSLSYPKLLVFLKNLAEDKPNELAEIYDVFLLAEIDRACKHNDQFALLWLGYIMYDSPNTSLLARLTVELEARQDDSRYIRELLKFLRSDNTEPILWEDNQSKLVFSHRMYLSSAELNEHLGISFGES